MVPVAFLESRESRYRDAVGRGSFPRLGLSGPQKASDSESHKIVQSN